MNSFPRETEQPGARPGCSRGFTVIELMIVIAIIGIVSAIAVPALLQARRSANHSATVGSLRTVGSAQRAFAATCGQDHYATRLTQLSQGSEQFISPDMGTADVVVKSGYRVTVDGGSDGVRADKDACNGVPATDLSTSYFATAAPVSPGTSGDYFYWMGTAATIYSNLGPITSTAGQAPPRTGRPLDEMTPDVKTGAIPEREP